MKTHHPTQALLSLLTLTVVLTVGCALIKPAARTANDIALKTCTDTFGASGDELPKGLTPKEFCSIHKNLHPFIDNILAAKMAVGESQGVTFKKE